MNSTDPSHPPESAALLPPQGRRWLVTLLLSLVIFVSGFATGGGTAVVLLARYTRENVTNPPLAWQRLLSFLERRLDLTEQQTRQVARILKTRQTKFMEIRRDVQPKVEAELSRLEQDIETVLTPQQQEEWREMIARLRSKWIPPLPPRQNAPQDPGP